VNFGRTQRSAGRVAAASRELESALVYRGDTRTTGAPMIAAQSTITADNHQVRVTTWTFEPEGSATGAHRHEFDYVVVPVTGGTFQVTSPDGSRREMTQAAGSPYLGMAGTAHDVANIGGTEAVFVEVELKGHTA
jgi:quercetin dioxygenase-like cupin family protein